MQICNVDMIEDPVNLLVKLLQNIKLFSENASSLTESWLVIHSALGRFVLGIGRTDLKNKIKRITQCTLFEPTQIITAVLAAISPL